MKPMLASAVEFWRLETLYPCYIQPKLDGIRCLIKDGQALSRSLKPLPNRYIQSWAEENADSLEGFDGELMTGPWSDGDVFKRTHSAVMSRDGEPDFMLALFDFWSRKGRYDDDYLLKVKTLQLPDRVSCVDTSIVRSEEDIQKRFANLISWGFEGAIIRAPNSPYKFGRSTPKQAYLLKMKAFIDDEATIVGFEELMHNGNPETSNELGYASHSSHKENMVPMGVLGSLVVECEGKFKETFNVGTGFDAYDREHLWERRESLLGQKVKFKYVKTDGYERPRFPVFLGLRDETDTGGE